MEKISMPSHILITGSKGQLGQEFQSLVSNQEYRDKRFYFTDRNSLDITNKSSLALFIEKNHIDTIVNCAAYTAVDNAEQQKAFAYKVNEEAVQYMAELAAEKVIKLIHISTDYVFDGTSHTPLCEDDMTNPQGVYAKSKHAGEVAILEANPKGAIIIRTSWVYSSYGNNFVHTMLRLGQEREKLNVVYDQIGTPTYARDLAKTILHILEQEEDPTKKKVTIYHYSNEGSASWYDFAKAIFEISKIDCKLSPISTIEYPTPAKRPPYTILNKEKIKRSYNLEIPYWRDSLKSCISVLRH